MIKAPVVVIGIGEMGSVFARGLLRTGHPVYPVIRTTDMHALADSINEPDMVLIAVGEAVLQEMLTQIPEQWKDKLALLQNELLPSDYATINNPTVISVWFEKKKGQDSKVLVPSPVFGPNAPLLQNALNSLDISSKLISNDADMLFELVVKNVYIVTTNIAGLRAGGTVGELWEQHQDFARAVISDVIAIQEALSGKQFDHATVIKAMLEAFEGDLQHNCMGRSAPARLQRALEHAEQHNLDVPTLREIAAEQ